jgi:hypothetical protein
MRAPLFTSYRMLVSGCSIFISSSRDLKYKMSFLVSQATVNSDSVLEQATVPLNLVQYTTPPPAYIKAIPVTDHLWAMVDAQSTSM